MYTRERFWDLEKGSTVFLKKGAIGIEKLSDEAFCSLMFYVPDDYIRSFMKENGSLAQSLKITSLTMNKSYRFRTTR